MLVRVPGWVSDYRVGRLAGALGPRLQRFTAARVLDVGCGLGRITARLQRDFPGFVFVGIDTVVQPRTVIPVERYDGERLPFADGSMDVVMLLDVLHHAEDPVHLLRECARVAGSLVLVKDHVCENWFDWLRLAGMDWLGNRPFPIAMTYRYFTRQEWRAACDSAGLTIEEWETAVRTCPPPLSLILERGLQVVAELTPRSP